MIIKATLTFLLLNFVPLKILNSQDMENAGLKKTRLVDEATHKTVELLCRKYNLVPIGTGGSMMYDIKNLFISFNCYRTLSIDQARGLIVICVREYLTQINKNTEIRTFLYNYPFSPENIEVSIYFYQPNGNEILNGQLCAVTTINGRIDYKTIRSEYQYELLKEETFEEALQILEKQKAL